MDQTLRDFSKKQSNKVMVDVRVNCKAAPESDLPDLDFTRCQAERRTSAVVQMQAKLNAHAHTPADVIKARSIASSTGFPHGHDAERLCCGQARSLIFEKQSLGFSEEVVASTAKIGRIRPTCWVVCKMARIRAYRVD
jgi:hypothetical protein